LSPETKCRREDKTMREINQVFVLTVIAGLFFFVSSCATIPHLEVNYRLPPETDTLSGQKVVLIVEDARANKDYLSPRAYVAFKDFPGNMSLNVAKHNGNPSKAGLYEPDLMIREGLKRRLQNEGVLVNYSGLEEEIRFLVVLTSFELDLIDRKWIVEMACEIKLIQRDKFLAGQGVSGRGERVKMLGTDEAGILIGDVFTDLINRVDLNGLFRRAKLL
jgi:hypothetical protein